MKKEKFLQENLQKKEEEHINFVEISKKIGCFLNENNAKKIEIYDVSKKTNLMKSMIFATVPNKEDCKNVSMELVSFIAQEGLELAHVDGFLKGEWIILDFNEIVVHLFNNSQRVKYNLEKLWKESNNSIPFKS